MKPSLLTLLLLTFCPSGFSQIRVVKAIHSGVWQTDAKNGTWGGLRPQGGDSIVIPQNVTVTLAKSASYLGVNYFLYDLSKKPTKLTISGTLLLGNATNFML